MSIKIEIKAKEILAVACFAAQKDMRNYLNGVLLEIWPARYRLVGTDGTALGLIQESVAIDLNGHHPDDGTPYRVIIPNLLVAKIKDKKGFVELTIEPDNSLANGPAELTLSLQDSSTIKMLAETGTFPDYQKIIPREFSGKAAQFSFALVNKFYKAYTMLAGKVGGRVCPCMRIAHNGDSGALVGFTGIDDFIGVIMPLRGSEVVKRPYWL